MSRCKKCSVSREIKKRKTCFIFIFGVSPVAFSGTSSSPTSQGFLALDPGIPCLISCRRSRDCSFLDLVFLTSTLRYLTDSNVNPSECNRHCTAYSITLTTLDNTASSIPPWTLPISEPTLNQLPASPSSITSHVGPDTLTAKQSRLFSLTLGVEPNKATLQGLASTLNSAGKMILSS